MTLSSKWMSQFIPVRLVNSLKSMKSMLMDSHEAPC